MPITKIRKEPKVSASNVNVSPGQQLDDALTAIGAALDAKASAADVAAVTGNRSNLDTTDKTNLVAAINEVNGNIPTSYNELTDKPIVKTSDNGFVIVAHGANRANKATAQNAFAEGGKTEAAGTSSHAEGFLTLAEGSASHSEGQGTQAVGTSSHAEGLSSLARGSSSHAEGDYTESVGSCAHAEGYNTAAYGTASHAEGYCMWSNRVVSRAYTAGDSYLYVKQEVYPGYVITSDTQTIGVKSCVLQEQDEDYRLTLDTPFTEDFAVAEILSIAPSAYGSYSHREGSYTVAMGTASHAEGNLSKALGNYSHAEGNATETQNFAEHASGKYNKSTPNVTQFSVGIGADEEHRANAYEVTTDGKMYVKGVGGYDGTNVGATGVKALGEAGSISYAAISDAPLKVTEQGGYAIGESTSAMASSAFAEGGNTYAVGDCSHAEGTVVNPGKNYVRFGYTAGSLTIRLEYLAKVGEILIVDNQVAIITSVTEETVGCTAYLDKAFTVDIDDGGEVLRRTGATGSCSHAEGTNCLAAGSSSHAEGKNTWASGQESHAEGLQTEANGDASHAEGYKCEATADYAHAEGHVAKASGEKSHAEGFGSHANGVASHAEGSNTIALGNNSHTEGYNTKTLGECSHAEGWNTLTRNKGEHACGRYNFSTTDVTLFSIGCGDEGQSGALDTLQNAFEVDVDGNVYIKGIGNYDGTNIGASGVKSVQQVIADLSGNN